MKEATKIIFEEGYKERYERHKKNAEAMQKALESMGFAILAEKDHRAVTLSNLIYPDGVEDGVFRNTLYEEGITVAGGDLELMQAKCSDWGIWEISISMMKLQSLAL